MAKWLVKTEASVYSVDDFKRDRMTQWTGVRNYQARNFLQSMCEGDEVLIYHSVDDPLGVVGIATVARSAYPDAEQFMRNSDFYDEKATREKPRWFAPDLKLLRKFNKPVNLQQIRSDKRLKDMMLTRRGMRLSVQPVQDAEFCAILELSNNTD